MAFRRLSDEEPEGEGGVPEDDGDLGPGSLDEGIESEEEGGEGGVE